MQVKVSERITVMGKDKELLRMMSCILLHFYIILCYTRYLICFINIPECFSEASYHSLLLMLIKVIIVAKFISAEISYRLAITGLSNIVNYHTVQSVKSVQMS